MHIAVSFLLVLVATVATYADPQYLYALPHQVQPYPYDAVYPVEPNYFRANSPSSSIDNLKPDQRFFGTVTLTLATTTSIFTSTTSTTCTTSSAALATCVAGGRRRRFATLGKDSRGLLFDEQNDEELSIYVRGPRSEVAAVQPEDNAVERVERSPITMIPFIIQPGFSAPENVRSGRFLVGFGTSTVTSTSIFTYTEILTATCSSVSDFRTCGNTGK